MVYGLLDGYYKVMSNIPKMGQLPTSVTILMAKKNERYQYLKILIIIPSGKHSQIANLNMAQSK